jgi:hypothetical protein
LFGLAKTGTALFQLLILVTNIVIYAEEKEDVLCDSRPTSKCQVYEFTMTLGIRLLSILLLRVSLPRAGWFESIPQNMLSGYYFQIVLLVLLVAFSNTAASSKNYV